MDCSLPGSSVDGILQARMLEVVAIPGVLPDPGTEPRFPVLQADSLMTEPPGKPIRRWSTPIIKLLLLILKVIVLYSVCDAETGILQTIPLSPGFLKGSTNVMLIGEQTNQLEERSGIFFTQFSSYLVVVGFPVFISLTNKAASLPWQHQFV